MRIYQNSAIMFDRFLFTLLCLSQLCGLGQSNLDWAYVGPEGPDHWAELQLEGNQCGGFRQSPIDINTRDAEFTLIEVEANGLNYEWSYFNLTNDNHTVVLHIPNEDSFRPTVIIYPDPNVVSDTFTFEALHFHFGSNDSFGSEHHIDGQIFPMEMHIVYYNSKYSSFTMAKEFCDGLLVFSTLFEISVLANMKYSPLVSHLAEVLYVGQTTTVSPGISLIDLFPQDLTTAYSYEGSLTTPTCNEAVRWFLFQDRVSISETQIEKFRELTIFPEPEKALLAGSLKVGSSIDGFISDNYRPVQPLNGRTVSRAKGRIGSK